MKCSPGFMLIEVLIASAIASILSIVLFMAYSQVQEATSTIDNTVQMHERIALLVNQLERDISGAFIPRKTKQDNQTSQQSATPASATPVAGQTPPTAQQDKAAQPKKSQKFTHIFYGVNNEEQLDELTFITNNPVQGYWSARAGKATPRIVRVMYRLERDKDKKYKKPSYVLMRQESTTLDYDAFKKDAAEPIRAYPLVRGIKDCTVTYGVEVESKKEAADKEDKKKQPKEFKVVDEWNKEKKASSSEQDKEQRAVPHEVTFAVTLWDAKQQRSTAVTIKVAITPDFLATFPAPQQQVPAQQTPAAGPLAQMPALQKTGQVAKQLLNSGAR
jgi:Tfp pilus assembly protein PilE